MGFGVAKGVYRGGKSLVTGGWNAVGKLGAHTKGLLVVGGGSYLGWQKLSTGTFPGEKTFKTGMEVVEKTGEAMSKGLDGVNKGLDYVNKGLDKAPELIHDTKEALAGGVSAVTGGASGQGGGLFGNLFGGISNLIGGLFNGGTGSMLGLVAGAFLLFGGFGWMGKIAGALLAALSLGLFGGNKQQQQQPVLQQAPVRQESDNDIIYPNMDMDGQIDNSHTIHRSR